MVIEKPKAPSILRKEGTMIYRNLNAEMARQGITQKELAKMVGRTGSTMSLKLNGLSSISLDEAKKIKKVLKSDLSLE